MYKMGVGGLDDQVSGVRGGTNLLVTGPAMSGKERFASTVLSQGIQNGDATIYVTTKDSVDEVTGRYRDVEGYDDEKFGVVDCVTQNQSSGGKEDTSTVKFASSPEDMTGIGIKVSELLTSFSEENGYERNRICVNSVSTLLMYSNLQTVFRFLHVFTGRVRSAEALGLFFLDSEMHDEKDYSTLKQLFDGSVEVRDTDPEVEVKVTGLGNQSTGWVPLD
ncbi:MAG: ATPase domain-containing protein [Halobacteria archaeon]|nr:ATPase domain-containing protein [Halobacteria archaeon]